MSNRETQVSYKNVFKNGVDAPEKSDFTKQWAALMNQLEKAKAFGKGKKED